MSNSTLSSLNVVVTSVQTNVPSKISSTNLRSSVAIANQGTTTIWFSADPAVNNATGFPLLAKEKISFDYCGDIYAIADTSAADVRVLEAN